MGQVSIWSLLLLMMMIYWVEPTEHQEQVVLGSTNHLRSFNMIRTT